MFAPVFLTFSMLKFAENCKHLHKNFLHLAAMVYAYFKQYRLRFSILHVYFQSISKLRFSVAY